MMPSSNPPLLVIFQATILRIYYQHSLHCTPLSKLKPLYPQMYLYQQISATTFSQIYLIYLISI